MQLTTRCSNDQGPLGTAAFLFVECFAVKQQQPGQEPYISLFWVLSKPGISHHDAQLLHSDARTLLLVLLSIDCDSIRNFRFKSLNIRRLVYFSLDGFNSTLFKSYGVFCMFFLFILCF